MLTLRKEQLDRFAADRVARFKAELAEYFQRCSYNPRALLNPDVRIFVDETVSFAISEGFTRRRSVKIFCMSCWLVPLDTLTLHANYKRITADKGTGEVEKAERIFELAFGEDAVNFA